MNSYNYLQRIGRAVLITASIAAFIFFIGRFAQAATLPSGNLTAPGAAAASGSAAQPDGRAMMAEFAPVQTPANLSAASAVIKGFYASLLDSMKQADQLGYSGRYKKLDPVIKADFNLPVMTRFAVGPAWTRATPDEQQALVSAFSDFTIANYAHQFAAYNGEEFAIIDEKPLDGGVMVETTLKPKNKDAVPLTYLMRQDDTGHYRIVDIFLNGSISQLAARRAEFNAITERDGIPALVSTLGEKSRQMGPT